MQWRAVAVAAVGLAVVVAAESVSYLPEEPGLATADATVGLAFIGLGVAAWERRPSSRSGLLIAATGFAWLAGSFAGAALFLHRRWFTGRSRQEYQICPLCGRSEMQYAGPSPLPSQPP
jgi:hypothetical protein